MITKIVLILLALVSITPHASSWTDKDRERSYKSKTSCVLNPLGQYLIGK